uniref:Uncharacterized protein isoform X2 n=1 Tax=Pogona vitticeps TaxID=103695 RepID=A0ABM5FY58_9SAUR
MEADIFKANDCGSQWAAEDSSEQVACHGTTDDNRGSSSSLSQGWVNRTVDVLTEQWTSPNSSTLARDGLSVNLDHAEEFQDIPFNYLATSLFTPHVSPATQAEMPSDRKNNETLQTPSCAAFASPLSTQETIFCQTMKQTPEEQEQLMRHQLEHLQRLVAEQQKIITFYNPGVSAALCHAQLPLGNSFQVQNQGCPQINPLIIKPTLQTCTTRTSGNNSFKEASEEHPEEAGANIEPIPESYEATTEESFRQNAERENNAGVKESWFETLPTIREEKGEKQIFENSSPSPFGVRMDTRNRNGDDRPIRPGIGVRQRTFEEFVEEQLKIDSQSAEKLQQTSCETKATAQKSFLKCGEGIARFEKNKGKPDKTLARSHRRVSFDCRNNSVWLAEQNTGELLGKCRQLKRQVSSPSVLFMNDNITDCIISKDDRRNQYNNHGGKQGIKKGSKSSHDPDGEELTSEKGSGLLSHINCSSCSQKCNENEIKAQMTGNKEASYPGCQPHQKVLEDRPIDSKVSFQLTKGTEKSVSQQVAGKPMDASANVSEFYNTEINQTPQEDQNSIFQVIQGVSKDRQCKHEYHDAVGKSPEIQIEISPGFKKVNDQIVKITSNPDRSQVTMTADLQREHHSSAGTTNKWEGKIFSDPDSTSTESEGEPKSHCSRYPLRHSTHTRAITSKSLDLSDADYATDEPSGAEDHLLKSHGILLTKRCGGQEPARKQDTSVVTSSSSSSSDSSLRDGCLNHGKNYSPFRKSPFHSSQTAIGGRDPEIQRNFMGNSDNREFSLKPSSSASHLVASLFPVFKSKANPEDKRAAEEHAQNRQMDKLEEYEGEALVHQKETSLLAQMKEEQAKAMAVLRQQINQIEAHSPGKMHSLEECNSDKALKMEKKGGNIEKHTIIIKKEGEVSEIQKLKQQIIGLQEAFRRNETQWHAAHDKLRSQVEALTKQNLELQYELRTSEHQKMEAERTHGHMEFPSRRTETPVAAAILSGASPPEDLQEGVLRGSRGSPGSGHGGRKMPPDVFVPKDRKTQATRSEWQKSELLKSTTGEPGMKSPPKTLHKRSVTPTGRKTPHQTPFEASSQVDQIQQQSYGRNSPLSSSNLNVFKDTSESSYVKGAYFSTSDSSEGAAFLNSQNNDILRSTVLDNMEKEKENLQRCKKTSGEVAAMAGSSGRSSVISNGRTTPSENISAARKTSPLKSILSRRTSVHIESKEDGEVKEKIEYPDGKVKQLLMDGRRITTYPNGTKVEIGADKRTTVVNYYNGDIKKILPDQTVIYYYADAQTSRTVFPHGLEVLQFPNKQIEKYYPDGTEEIVFPDQTVKLRYDGGLEETLFPDGTVVKVEKSGVKTIRFRNGQKAIHSAVSTRREYPDGTIKTIYPNGQQGTKYSSGRVQIKDERETLIADKK